MNCPNDNTTLLITERNGIEIDYCPQCRGVWLDRGELDKLIDRSNDFVTRENHNHESRHSDRDHMPHRPYDNDEDYRHHDTHHKKHSRENPLADLFDF